MARIRPGPPISIHRVLMSHTCRLGETKQQSRQTLVSESHFTFPVSPAPALHGPGPERLRRARPPRSAMKKLPAIFVYGEGNHRVEQASQGGKTS